MCERRATQHEHDHHADRNRLRDASYSCVGLPNERLNHDGPTHQASNRHRRSHFSTPSNPTLAWNRRELNHAQCLVSTL